MVSNLFVFNKEYPSIFKEKTFPSLNGIRGIAILLVLVYHIWNTVNGSLGVAVFFVISGFLISILFLRERADHGSFSLKYFYKRRILRIFPVFYLYLFVLTILNLVFQLGISKYNLLGSAFYLLDFSWFRKHYFSSFTGHIWSLAVEEQFYLFIPLIFKRSYRLYVGTVLFLVFLLPLICLLQAYYQPLNTGVLYYFTHFLIKFQAISVGCLLAILVFNGNLIFKMPVWMKIAANLAAIFMIYQLDYGSFYTIQVVFKNLLICFLIAFVIVSNLVKSEDVVFKFLNWKALSFTGIISYSLYIWHPLFTWSDNRLPHLKTNPFYCLILIVVVSCLSYFGYERVFLKLKSRIRR